jgi:3-oxoacyl-[acyl-carrier protein] reductase
MELNLKNKRVLITGSSQGIGYVIAQHFLEEGANVILVGRNIENLKSSESELIKQYGNDKVWSKPCDCSSSESLQELHDAIKNKFGGIDIVIANIGDGRSVPDPIPDNEQWQRLWNINFESALLTARSFLPMLENAKGVLLFISSITALEAFGAPVDYSTAKSAVVAFSKNLARKVAEKVRVNVIAPGNVNFPGSSWDEKIKQDASRVKNIIDLTVPMKRFGTPDEIADAALFLCSSRASFITGSVLVVDGGQTVGIF